jgi:hypothetical protein
MYLYLTAGLVRFHLRPFSMLDWRGTGMGWRNTRVEQESSRKCRIVILEVDQVDRQVMVV